MSWAGYAKQYFVFIFACSLPLSGGPGFLLSNRTALFQTADGGGDVPSGEEQQRLLGLMRNYAEDYISRLPNFICQQVVYQYEAGRKTTRWRKGDTLTSKLVFNNGKEERTLEAVNDKPVTRGARPWRAPLTTAGELGILLSNIFDPVSQTRFDWAKWDVVDGKRLAEFNFSISQEHSTLSLSLSDLAKAVIAYSGSVWADPQTGAVWRIVSQLNDIPKSLQTRSSETTIDYQNVRIGNQDYLLPAKAQVEMVISNNHIRNEMQFGSYRKFEAESTLSFGDGQGGNVKEQKPQ